MIDSLNELFINNNNQNYYKTFNGLITNLKDNQVFVFGSNLKGFHGAGSAGFASFGKVANWRDYFYDLLPDGWKGYWNVKGIYEGFQEGVSGKSYALPTIINPGERKSLSFEEIVNNIEKLYKFAYINNQYEFLISYKNDNRNLNGYTSKEMANAFSSFWIPFNIVFDVNFFKLLKIFKPLPTLEELKNIDVIEPMNYEHNKINIGQDNPGIFRNEIINKNIFTSFDAIKYGLRTATSRNYKIGISEIGQLVIFTKKDRHEKLICRITKLFYPITEISKEEWSKLEGWDVSYFNLNPSIKNMKQFQFEYVGSIDENYKWLHLPEKYKYLL